MFTHTQKHSVCVCARILMAILVAVLIVMPITGITGPGRAEGMGWSTSWHIDEPRMNQLKSLIRSMAWVSWWVMFKAERVIYGNILMFMSRMRISRARGQTGHTFLHSSIITRQASNPLEPSSQYQGRFHSYKHDHDCCQDERKVSCHIPVSFRVYIG